MGGVSTTRNIQVIRTVKGADGLTPMPNLLRNADLNPKSVSVKEEHNEGCAWGASIEKGGIIRHEPDVLAPHAGAKVISCESFKRSTPWRDNVECYGCIYQNLHLTAGVTYTFSVYVKGTDAGWLIAWPIDGTHVKTSGENLVDEGQNTAEGWKRYAVTFTPRVSGGTNVYLRSWSRNQHEEGGKVYFACPKLEESFRPTPWTRAQEDFRGAAMRPLGDWDALPDGFRFQSGGVGEEFIDLVSVKSEGALLWWSCKRSHAKTKDTRPNVNAPFWELGQNLKFVATDLLLAKKAFIENLGVRNVETRNAAQQVVFRAEENGDVFIGGKATIGGFRKNIPVIITPENYEQYLEKKEGNDLFFSPFTIGVSILFFGKFPRNKRIFISNTNPDVVGKDTFRVGTEAEKRYFSALAQYLGTQVYIGNYTSGVGYDATWINIQGWNKSENTIKYREVFRLDFGYKKTQPYVDEHGNPSQEGLYSIWRPTKLTLNT